MSTFYQMSETVPHKMSETVPDKITTNNLKKTIRQIFSSNL